MLCPDRCSEMTLSDRGSAPATERPNAAVSLSAEVDGETPGRCDCRLLEDSHVSPWDDHGHGTAARRACDSVARAGGWEGARLPNAELEVPTLCCGKSGGGNAESKSGCSQRDAHERLWHGSLGWASVPE
jgi:hypothetical protein